MRVLITGAAGMIGGKLLHRLVADQRIGDEALQQITLCDVVAPPVPPDAAVPIDVVTGDLRSAATRDSLVATRPDLIFHLAAVVSGEAELDFEKGYGINLDGTHGLLESIRAAAYCPRFVFASSIAVFGAPFPDAIPDHFFTTPRTSYGTQKAIGELLVADYSRRGFLDGIALRLPTICVRPGKPNKAASGFFSNIIREPLRGEPAVLPVDENVRHWFASPRVAVNFLTHAACLDSTAVGVRRAVTLSWPVSNSRRTD